MEAQPQAAGTMMNVSAYINIFNPYSSPVPWGTSHIPILQAK